MVHVYCTGTSGSEASDEPLEQAGSAQLLQYISAAGTPYLDPSTVNGAGKQFDALVECATFAVVNGSGPLTMIWSN